MTTDTARIRAASGNVQSGDPLVAFLYLLMRSYLPLGTVADIILEVEHLRPEYHEALFSNGWLATYAADCAARLHPAPVTDDCSATAAPGVRFNLTLLQSRTPTEVVVPVKDVA